MLTDKGDISNYLGVNKKKNSDETIELLQSHLAEKIINHFGLTVSASLKSIETPAVKPLLRKDESSLGIKCACNYRSAASMLSYIHVSKQTEISMAVHQCAQFFNNPCLVHELVVRLISKYRVIMSTYVNLLYGN